MDNTIHDILQLLTTCRGISTWWNGAAECNKCRRFEELELKIEKSIHGLKRSLLELQNLKTDLNYAHSQIIRKLPPEVMSRIFQFVLPLSTMDTDRFTT